MSIQDLHRLSIGQALMALSRKKESGGSGKDDLPDPLNMEACETLLAALPDSIIIQKVSDPKFIVDRLKDGKDSIILSESSHEDLADKEWILVNDRVKPGERIKAWAQVRFIQAKETIKSVRELGDLTLALDRISLREFQGREGPFYILRLELIEAFDEPVELKESPAEKMKEAFHLRDVHWVPVPESGNCPSTHPSKLKFPGTETLRCFKPSAARVVRARMREQERPPLKTQTYILSKERFETQAEADKWMDDNNAPRPKVDEKEDTFRYRQFPPERCEEGSQRTVRITDGVQIVGCRLKPEFQEAITPFKDLPLADRARAWDSDGAKARVRRWATTDDKIDFDRYSMAFLVVDGPEDNLTSYKLPFADFIDGQLRAVPRGIFAAAGVLQGARGGVDLPSGDLTRAQNHLGQYYSKMELRAPWETEESLSEQAEKLTNERANLREANPDNPTERCGFCVYFREPTDCQIVDGPVAEDQVCDWIFSRETEAGLYNIADEDWLAFVKGMVEKQPYQHIVRDGAITPEGPVVMIEDTAEPPHRFSLTKQFHVEHSSLEHHWTQAEVDDLVAVGKGMTEAELEEGIRPAFGSPGGKRHLAHTIISLIPDHKKYIEPFIGGGAVFFAREPSEIEVINDKDAEIIKAYRFIQGITTDNVARLKTMPTMASRKTFNAIKEQNPRSPAEVFHRFIYLKAFSKNEGESYRSFNDGTDIRERFDRFLRVRDRLSGVRIKNQDYKEVIKAEDGPDVFFYLDPPYPGTSCAFNAEADLSGLGQILKEIRGKFILSLSPKSKFNASGFHTRRVSDRRIGNRDAGNETELLISNFPLGKQRVAASLSESFRIDLKYVPEEEPTHEELESKRAEIMKKFEDFVKAEFPKGEIKVELENLIPKEMQEKYDGRAGPQFKALRNGRTTLTEDERDVAMKAKAVWHHGPNGEETCAVWKSIVNGRIWYVCNTHRAYNVVPTLKGAIKQFHDFIKGTA